jgi:predicted HAD superfamily Cof-like phosphohydrolase
MQTLSETIARVIEFHEAFGLPVQRQPEAGPGENVVRLRHRLMQEENDEYLEAALQSDLEGIADALGDKLYILCGTIIAHGLQDKIAAVFNEIHRSNMSKLDENGRPIVRDDGKVLKSERFVLPDIRSVLAP